MILTALWAIIWAVNGFPHIFENPTWFIFLVLALLMDSA
jgi:hypothetical protein